MQTVIDHIQRKAIANAFSESAGHSIAVDKIDEAIQTSENLQQVAGSIAKRKEICCRALDSVFNERKTLLNGQIVTETVPHIIVLHTFTRNIDVKKLY